VLSYLWEVFVPRLNEKEYEMTQTLKEYLQNPPPVVVEICGCGCGKPLEKNDPLGPRWVGKGKDRKLINEDCYFEQMSAGIDKYPIGGLGIHGPKSSVLDDGFICAYHKSGGPGCAD